MISLKSSVMRVLNNEILFASLILIIVLAGFYHDVVFEGKTFLVSPNFSGVMSGGPYGYPGTQVPLDQFVLYDPAAIFLQSEPWSREIYHTLLSGQLPLWSPYQGIGAPLHANAQSGAFDPFLLLVNLVPDSLFPYTNDLQLLVRYYLAGLFTYLFVRAIGVGRIGSIAAAFGYIFSSFFVVFGNIPLARADLLLPMLMYAAHKLVLKSSWRAFALVAFTWWLIIVSGFPESLPFPLMLVFLWCLLMVGLGVAKRQQIISHKTLAPLARFILAIGVGTALSAFFLIPFIEFFLLSDHRGPVGFPLWKSVADVVSFALAMLFPIRRHPLNLTNYNGIILILAFGAMATYWIKRKNQPQYTYFSRLAAMTCLVAAGYILSQALPLFNELPLLNLIYLQRHLQPLLIFCVACVAGFGIEWWMQEKISNTAIFLATALLIIFFALILADGGTSIPNYPFGGQYDQNTLIVVLGIPLVFCFLSWLTTRFVPRTTVIASLALLPIVIAPLLWFRGTQRPVRYDPFTSPPFVEYLQRVSTGDARILGLESVLVPNTSSAYGIDDIRYLNALFPNRFVDVAEETIYSEVEVSRFSGGEPNIFLDRGINLLNVEYIVTPQSYPAAFLNRLNPIESQVANLSHHWISLNGELREVVNDGISSPFSIKFRVSPGATQLSVSYGIDPQVWACNCGLPDGAIFQIDLYDLDSSDTSPHILLEREFDPVQNPIARQWTGEHLDLTSWSGHEIELRFSEASVSAEGQLEWAYWGIPTVTTNDFIFPYPEELDENEHQPISHLFDLPVSIDLNSNFRQVIFRHAPASMQTTLLVPENAALEFEFGLSEVLWNEESVGDGVSFSVFVISDDGEQRVFDRYIDPKHNSSDRRWYPVKLDLSPWGGENISIRFVTDPGPAGDSDADWSYWSNLTLVAPNIDTSTDIVQNIDQFEPVYEDEFVRIFYNRHAFPRAFVVYQAEQVQSLDEAIHRLEAADFNPAQAVLIEGELPQEIVDNLATTDPSILPGVAEIVERTANSLKLSVSTEQPGLLVTSEQYFPGWNVWVDDLPAEIYLVNGMMRAVYLNAGDHIVEFLYRPWSFFIGIFVSLGTLISVPVWYIVSPRLYRRVIDAKR